VSVGKFIRIAIADTGIGMDKAVRDRIFDPFFTTKEKSRGTGLGLASAFGIIRNHNGFITVNSKSGHGTTFAIHLPASAKAVAPERPTTGSEKSILPCAYCSPAATRAMGRPRR
jgi:signal transduction histidine kinase